MAVNPDDKGAARLARPGAAFKQYWVLFIGKITAAQPFEYSPTRDNTPQSPIDPYWPLPLTMMMLREDLVSTMEHCADDFQCAA